MYVEQFVVCVQNFKPCPLINGKAFMKHGKNEETMMDNRQTQSIISRRAAMKLAWFWLRTDRRLLQAGKFIVFCLVRGNSGCIGLEKWGGGAWPPGPLSSNTCAVCIQLEFCLRYYCSFMYTHLCIKNWLSSITIDRVIINNHYPTKWWIKWSDFCLTNRPALD